MVMMLPPQVRYSSPQQMAGDDFFMGASSPRVGMSSNTLGELAGLVASANVDPMYREAAIANPNYNMPGSAEAHARYGIPPVVVQSDPYATLAFAAGPGGSVAPLIGYPSRYPHVLNGVPTPYGGGTLGGLLSGLMQMGRLGQFQLHPLVLQATQQQPRRAGSSGGGGGGGSSTRRTQAAEKIPGPTIPPPHVRYAGTESIPGPTIPPPHVRYAGTESIPGPTIPPPHVRYAGMVPAAPENTSAATALTGQPTVQPQPPLAPSHVRYAGNQQPPLAPSHVRYAGNQQPPLAPSHVRYAGNQQPPLAPSHVRYAGNQQPPLASSHARYAGMVPTAPESTPAAATPTGLSSSAAAQRAAAERIGWTDGMYPVAPTAPAPVVASAAPALIDPAQVALAQDNPVVMANNPNISMQVPMMSLSIPEYSAAAQRAAAERIGWVDGAYPVQPTVQPQPPLASSHARYAGNQLPPLAPMAPPAVVPMRLPAAMLQPAAPALTLPPTQLRY